MLGQHGQMSPHGWRTEDNYLWESSIHLKGAKCKVLWGEMCFFRTFLWQQGSQVHYCKKKKKTQKIEKCATVIWYHEYQIKSPYSSVHIYNNCVFFLCCFAIIGSGKFPVYPVRRQLTGLMSWTYWPWWYHSSWLCDYLWPFEHSS